MACTGRADANGNATAVVDRLETDGFVRRRPSETDRRTVYVALTDEGLRAFEGMADQHEMEVDRLLSDLTDEDLEALTVMFRKFGKRDAR